MCNGILSAADAAHAYNAVCAARRMERYIIRSLAAINPGRTTAEEFASCTGCGTSSARSIMEWWEDNGIGRYDGDGYTCEAGHRLEAAIMLLRTGCHIQQIATHLHWRDFEGMVARILESHQFEVKRNYTMIRPRMELDVVGTRMNTAVAIDCKHWSRTGKSAIDRAASKQSARARRYASAHKIDTVPAIVTLYPEHAYAEGIPVIPVHNLDSFVDGLFGNMDTMTVIKAP